MRFEHSTPNIQRYLELMRRAAALDPSSKRSEFCKYHPRCKFRDTGCKYVHASKELMQRINEFKTLAYADERAMTERNKHVEEHRTRFKPVRFQVLSAHPCSSTVGVRAWLDHSPYEDALKELQRSPHRRDVCLAITYCASDGFCSGYEDGYPSENYDASGHGFGTEYAFCARKWFGLGSEREIRSGYTRYYFHIQSEHNVAVVEMRIVKAVKIEDDFGQYEYRADGSHVVREEFIPRETFYEDDDAVLRRYKKNRWT